MTTYSHSRLGTFQHCKYKFKLRYIDKVKVEIPTTVEMFMGDMVHRTLYKLYKDLQYQKINSKEEILGFYEELWNKEWSEDILIAKKEYSVDNYKKIGTKCLIDYYDRHKPFNSLITLGLETQNMLPLSNGDSYHIRIDRLSADKEGNYFIVDYKTNSSLKTQDELDEDRQLAMYSIWVKKTFPDYKSVKLTWHFLAFDKEIISIRTDEQLIQLQSEVESLIEEIKACKEFPTNVTRLCDWCEFKQICPAFKHDYELEQKTIEGFKEDDGLKLVDKFSALKTTISELEKEMEEIKEKLIEFSKQKEISAVYGSNKKISLKTFETISFPAKKDRDELNELIKDKGLWEELSDLDTFKLSKLVKEGKLPKELKKDIGKFITKAESYRLSLGKK